MVSPMHGMERAAVGEVTLLFFLPASLASRKSVLFEKSSCINLIIKNGSIINQSLGIHLTNTENVTNIFQGFL